MNAAAATTRKEDDSDAAAAVSLTVQCSVIVQILNRNVV